MNEKIKEIAKTIFDRYIAERMERFPSLAALDLDDLLIAASYQARKDSLLEYDEDEASEYKMIREHGALEQMERRFLAHYIEVCYIEAGAIKKGAEYHLQLQAFGDWAAETCLDDYADEEALKSEIANLIFRDKQYDAYFSRPAEKNN